MAEPYWKQPFPKQTLGGIQQRYPQEALMQHEHDKASDWIKLVPVVYGGAANYNRKFRKAGTRDFIMMNEFLGYEDDGVTPIIRNDLSEIERVEVTIGKSNESDFAKQAAREYDLEMLKVIRLNETNSELIAVIENNLYGEPGENDCLGATIFEWNDEWWKFQTDNPSTWAVHNTQADWSNGEYYFDIGVAGGTNMNEEWFGIVATGRLACLQPRDRQFLEPSVRPWII